MEIKFVEETNADLAALSAKLDDFYVDRFGEAYLPDQRHNALTGLAGAVVAYEADRAVGCACWRALDAVTAEIKRVYVCPENRKCGIAQAMIQTLEQHAAASGCHRAVLETAKQMPDAIAVYQKIGYSVLEEGFGPDKDDENCVFLVNVVSDGTMR